MDDKTTKLLIAHQQARLQREQIEQQEQADRNRAQEAQQLAYIQSKQAEILLSQSLEQEKTNKKLLEIENNKLLEETKRTKIAFESLLSEQEVFDKGYNFDFSHIDPTDTSEIKITQGEIDRDLRLHIDLENLCKNFFLLPKLNKAFQSGVSKRWEEIKFDKPNLDLLNIKSYEAGFEGKSTFLIEYIHDSIKDSGIVFILKSQDKLFDIKSEYDNITGIKNFTLINLNLPFPDVEYFEELNLSYKKGIETRIINLNNSENTEQKIQERLELQSKRLEELEQLRLEKINRFELNSINSKQKVMYIALAIFLLVIIILFKNSMSNSVENVSKNTQKLENNKKMSEEDKLYNDWRFRQRQ